MTLLNFEPGLVITLNQMKSSKNQQNTIFSLCYIAQINMFPEQFTRNLLLFYGTAYVTHMLTLKHTSIFNFNFQINSTAFMILFGFVLLVLCQSLLFLVIGKQFYLGAQIKLFRYTLMDQGINFMIRQLINRTNSTGSVTIFLFIFYLLVNVVITSSISFEKYQEKTLMPVHFSFSFYFFLFNLLLQLIDNTTFHTLKSSLFILLLFCIYNAIQNEANICSERWEKIFISFIVKSTLIITIYLLMRHILSQSINSYLFYIILLGVYIILGILITQRSKILKTIELESPQDTSYFLKKVQTISFDIDSVLSGTKKFEETELKAYLSKHQQLCKIPSCPLFGEESKTEIRSLHEMKSIKNVVKKLKRHLQFHFQQRYLLNSADTTLSFAYLCFLIFYSLHKRKAFQIYSTLIKEEYSFNKSYQLYKLKNKLDTLQDEESVITKNASNLLFQTFNEHTSNIIDIFRKICNLLLQEKIDFNSLTSITDQLNNQRLQLDEFIEKVFKIQTFGSFKILSLYSQYCKDIFQEHQKAQYIEKHLSNLIEKLEHKKQVQYLSNRSQVGLVAISLSENSLGNVFSINQFAQSIFGFQAKDIIGKSVNNIMPSTFAEYHDSLLMVFLKNRTKKVNGDERALVAKHKNGLIFPVMLRLQRVIVSSDELVFVANIRKYKTRQSPLMFITTPEGEVVDHSAGFQYYFMKKGDKKQKRLNIYEISPNFDEVTQQNTSNFSICYEYKSGMTVSVDFKVTPLAFFGNLQAYYLFGTKTMETSKNSATSVLPITNIFSDLILKERLRCHYNNFVVEKTNSFYSISTHMMKIDPRDSKNRELTIPFIHLNDFSGLIQLAESAPINYAKGIRAIRLINRHFEPIQQPQSEISQQQLPSEDKVFLSSKRKVISIDEIQQQCDNLSITQTFIFCTTLMMIILNICSNSLVTSVNQNKNSSLLIEIAQYEVKQYISDFILFSNFKNLNYSKDIFVSAFNDVQNRVVNALQSDLIPEESKEYYMKIIYSQHTWSTIGEQLAKPFLTIDSSSLHLIIWYGNIALICLLLICYISYSWNFKKKIYMIYTYFLYLDETMVLTLLSKCQKLNIMSSGKENSITQSYSSGYIRQETEDNDPNFIKKSKSFNNSSRKHDFIYMIQTFGWIVVLGVIVSVLIVKSSSIGKEIDAVSALSSKMSRIQAESSVLILSSFLSQSASNMSLTSNFDVYLQHLQNEMVEYASNEGNTTLIGIFNTFISGNICNSSVFSSLNIGTCQKSANNISTNGVLSALDFINSQIIQINANSTPISALQRLSILTLLQYEVIEKSITIINNILDQIKIGQQQSLISIYYILCIIIIFILIFQMMFLMNVPFKNMKNQIKLVYQIIELFESIKKTKSKPPSAASSVK